MMATRILDNDALRQVQIRIARGETAKEIAELLGVAYNTLRTQCSRKKICLVPGTPLPHDFLKSIKHIDLSVRVTPAAARDLASRAQARGIDMARFAGLLLNTISNDDLYQAVLDEDAPRR